MEEIAKLFDVFGVWTWWLVAAALATLELLAPGVFFIWLAGAAALVGVVVFAVDPSWEWQVALFAVLSVVSLGLSRFYMKRTNVQPTDNPMLNRRGDVYIGREFALKEAIVNGRGKVKVEDTVWLAGGDDMAAGTRVKVIGVEGNILTVEKA